MFGAAVALFVMLAANVANHEPSWPPRLRALSAGAETVFEAATRRSETVRRLVDAIEASDLIVYITDTKPLPLGVGGALRFMTRSASGHRFLRIDLRPGDRRPGPGLNEAVATLAHELTHALEIAEARHVVDAASFNRFYKAHAAEQRDAVYDTRAAQTIGRHVRYELGAVKHGGS